MAKPVGFCHIRIKKSSVGNDTFIIN